VKSGCVYTKATDTAIGVSKAIDDNPDRAKKAYMKPIEAKKRTSFLVAKCSFLVQAIAKKRTTRLKARRKNNCSKLDIPVFFNTVLNIKMKLKPRVARTTRI